METTVPPFYVLEWVSNVPLCQVIENWTFLKTLLKFFSIVPKSLWAKSQGVNPQLHIVPNIPQDNTNNQASIVPGFYSFRRGDPCSTVSRKWPVDHTFIALEIWNPLCPGNYEAGDGTGTHSCTHSRIWLETKGMNRSGAWKKHKHQLFWSVKLLHLGHWLKNGGNFFFALLVTPLFSLTKKWREVFFFIFHSFRDSTFVIYLKMEGNFFLFFRSLRDS